MAARELRIGVVGAGIAGCGAAWSLDRAGFEVELFEAKPTIGGNAKTHAWQVEDRTLCTGLSVLAWPRALFRNYRCLLEQLDVATEPVDLRVFIRCGDEVYTTGRAEDLAARYAPDLQRWRRMVDWVGRVNRIFNRSPKLDSLYHVAPLNPLNLIPLRTLARGFGMARGFWTDVVVPLHSATFLTTRLDSIPAVIVPIIDAIMPLDRPARLDTWQRDSSEVFRKLTAGFADRVHTSCPITRITTDREGVELVDGHGDAHRFDRVVLAGPVSGSRGWLYDRLRGGATYSDEKDSTFRTGIVHGDPTVIAPEDRNEVLADCCNYVRVIHDPNGAIRYENHFVLSSWIPAARGLRRPMLVSYGNPEAPAASHRETSVDNRRAHPELSVGNLTRALLHRCLQGRDRLYYCGGLATPGNGHDLSLLSGLVVAERIGAAYPFAANVEARADFERLRRFMLSGR